MASIWAMRTRTSAPPAANSAAKQSSARLPRLAATGESAARAGASYLSFGAFFPSPTKPLAPRASIDLLRQSAALGVPRVAIGGITPDNGTPLIEAGADFLAAVSAVFGASDVRTAAQRFADMFSSDRESTR